MSLPNQPPQQHTTAAASPSLSSSKQSVRATPGPSTHPAPEHSQYDDPRDNNASQRYGNDQLLSDLQHAQDPHPHPQFQPFFTLVEDANTGEYHHPTVHYIFSDDDTDILTEAAERSLEQEQQESDNQAGVAARGAGKAQRQHRHRQGQGQGQDESEEGESYDEENVKDPILPPPIPGVRDNYLILDVEPTSADTLQQKQQQQQQPKQDDQPNTGGGLKSISSSPATQPTTLPPPQQQPQQQPQFKVASAHSLTPTWQVLNTELVPAPTFENNASPNDPQQQQDQPQQQPLNGGLMLKIHGTPGQPPVTSTKDRDKERGSQRLEDMMDQFAKRMSELQRVIEAGEVSGLGTGFEPGLDGENHERGQMEQQQQQQDIGENQLVEDHGGNGNNNTAEEVSGQEEGQAGPSNTN